MGQEWQSSCPVIREKMKYLIPKIEIVRQKHIPGKFFFLSQGSANSRPKRIFEDKSQSNSLYSTGLFFLLFLNTQGGLHPFVLCQGPQRPRQQDLDYAVRSLGGEER